MGEAYFYHLTESPIEAALPALVERARAAGWRVEVRVPDAPTGEMLDAALWRGPDDRFLPHGLAGGAHDALQPVLIRVDGGGPAANAASCLMAVGGASVAAAEVADLARTCILFDGHDAAALTAARAHWKALTSAGAGAQYWAQEDGRWVKKAEHAAA